MTHPYRVPFYPEITIVGVEADPFPQKRRTIDPGRLRQLLKIERAAQRLRRATEQADAARAGFPDARELNDRLAASVIQAFESLLVALEAK